MAHKSKTQRAKATAQKAARKERQERDEVAAEAAAAAIASGEKPAVDPKAEKAQARAQKAAEKAAAAEAKAEAKKLKPKRFQFLRDVRAELKRVTWPSRQDVMRWSVVVVAALIFFGVYVFILDYGIITKVLFALSSLAG